MSLQHTVELDIRVEEVDFGSIMKVVQSLKDHEILTLHAKFNLSPLYPIMKNKGYEHDALKVGEGYWKINFYKKKKKNQLDLTQADTSTIIFKALQILEQLKIGEQVTIVTEHFPDILQRQLNESYFEYYKSQSPEGYMILEIRRVN